MIDGLEVNLLVDEKGNANWETQKAERPETAAGEAAPSAETGDTFALDITRIEITDTRVEYRDRSAGQHYVIDIPSISTGAVRYDEPVQLDARLILEDRIADISSNTTAAGQLTFDAGFNRFSVADMRLDNTMAIPDLPELALQTILTGEFDTVHQVARIEEGSLTLGPMNAAFSIEVNDLFGAPHYGGAFKSPPFDARELLPMLGIEVKTANPDALSSVEFSANIAGELPAVRFEKVYARLDNSLIKGNVTTTLEDKIGVDFALDMDQLNATDYLEPEPAPSGAEDAPAGAGVEDAEIIPVELLNEYDISGRLTIEALQYDTYNLSQAVLELDSKQEKLTAGVTAGGYEGDLELGLSADIGEPMSGRITADIDGINLTRLTEWEWITGTLNATSKTTFKGNMLSRILETIDGPTTFTIKDGTLDVTPIKALAAQIDAVRGKTSSISEWPDTMSFDRLEGQHRLNDGIAQNQVFGFRLENLNVAGTGGIDYWQNHLSYDIDVTLEDTQAGQFKVNPSLAGVAWPLHCEGALDESPVDSCRPDSDAVGRLVADLAKQEIKRKGEEKVEELRDKAKELLKGLFDR